MFVGGGAELEEDIDHEDGHSFGLAFKQVVDDRLERRVIGQAAVPICSMIDHRPRNPAESFHWPTRVRSRTACCNPCWKSTWSHPSQPLAETNTRMCLGSRTCPGSRDPLGSP